MNAPAPGQPAGTATPQIWPLTPPQRALWFLENFNPDSSFYVIGMGLVLDGELRQQALFDALDDCVARHEALRTRFLTLGGRPYQVFVPDQPVDRSVVGLDGDDPLAEARALLAELSSTSFDLTAEAPIRTRLLRVGQDRHVLLFAIHHIVFDGWSTQILLADLAEAYRVRAAGEVPLLSAQDTGIGEYATRLSAQDAVGTGLDPDELAYWRDTLRYAPVLDLPSDHPRPERRTFAGAVHTVELPARTAAAVSALARTLHTTPFTVLGTAFTRLMADLTGTEDVVIGVPLAGRTDADALGMVGFFANTLPLRVDLAGVGSFREALERHRAVHEELLDRQHVPFARLVEALKPQRRANRNPYYDVCFQYLPAPDRGADFGGLQVGSLGTVRSASQFDLSCDVHQTKDTLRVHFEYSTELFDETTIRRYAEEFTRLVRAVVTEPVAEDRPSAPAPALSPQAAMASAHRGLPDVVAAQAALRPDREAVRDAGESMTFAELDAAAAHHAAVLSARGLGSGDRVAVLAAPSVRQVAAMLGVLRSGAVHVPLDPRTPAERLAHMVAAADCALVLHDEPARDTAAALAVPALPLGTLPARAQPRQDSTPYAPDDPAYIIFTSGSTGRPKGVVVPHRAALSLARAAAEVYELTDRDTVLSMASPAVDVFVEETFASWEAGATVLVHGSDISDVSRLVAQQRLTVLNLPAALWHEWTRQAVAGETAVPGGLRLVVAGSDRVDPARVRQWHDGAGAGVRLFNAYGVTEAAVTSTWYDTAELARDAEHTPHVPIGRPLPNTVLHVLDEHGEQVPQGVPGELYIGGSGVALGYLDAPEETTARFLPDPFLDGTGHRMYRTGDRVRMLPSGALEFRGRLDGQVKIRGTRIELAEVERVASETPGIAGFAADVRTDAQGTPRLVGYLRTAGEESGEALDHARVDEWKEVHDADVFNEVEDGQSTDLNASGWLSSYDLQPIPAEAMAEWRDEAVGRILAQAPGRVLEIGCGTGMLLLRAAPHAETYVGTDISPRALSYVAGQLPSTGLDDGRVRLVEAPAHDLSAVGDEQFDLVVLNSVVQYFPTSRYLDEVLTQAWRRLRPGGRLIVGDVRDLTLLRAFHLSVQRFRNPTADLRTLLDGVDEAVENENELCLAPDYFHALAARLPEVAGVDVRAKSGRAATEMNGFRFDAVLHRAGAADASPRPLAGPRIVEGGELSLPRLRGLLWGTGEQGIVIRGVRDARVTDHTALHDALSDPSCVSLAEAVDRRPHAVAVRPADLEEAAAEAGMVLALTATGEGLIDVTAAPAPFMAPSPATARTTSEQPATGTCANRPLESALRRELLRRVREHMARHLPRPMIPSRLVFVEDFPLTVSGKVDRARLPEPAQAASRSTHLLPTTATERALAGLWEETLGLDVVGLDDNFFEIGGDSISWLRIVSRGAGLGLALTARDVFQHQTLRDLATAVQERAGDTGTRAASAVVPGDEPADAALTPVQQWFFDTFTEGRDRQTQSQWFALDGSCPLPDLRRALHDVVSRHTALGLRFVRTGGTWRQEAVPRTAQPVVAEIVLPASGPERELALFEGSEAAQDGLSVSEGPLLRAVLFRTPGDEPDLFFWCIHHLVVDAVSWQILGEDLTTALEARLRGGGPELPPAGASFLRWSRWSRQTSAEIPDRERQYWQDVRRGGDLAVPVRHAAATGRYGQAHRLTRRVSVTVPTNRRSGNRLLATCLTALRRSLTPLTGRTSGSVTLEFHGRPTSGEAPDVARTVGWFTALFPFVLEDEPATETAERLARVPDGGTGHGRLCQENDSPVITGDSGVVVNYLGAGTATPAGARLTPFTPSDFAVGRDVDARAVMPFAVELGFALSGDGTVTADLVLSDRHFDTTEAARFADDLAAALGRAFGAPFTLLPRGTRQSPAFARLLTEHPIQDAYPLAPMQRMMLNRHLLSGSKDANYNEAVLDLHGPLDPDLLQRAWRELTARYDVLRTSVEWQELPEPLQVVHRDPPSALNCLDWTSLTRVQVQRRLEALLEEHRSAPPELCGAPPYRLVLIRTGPRQARLVWTDHHILLDGWSSSLLVGELVRTYTRLARDEQPFRDEAPPTSYGSFVRWLGERPAGRAKDFWRQQLGGFVTPTQLPFDVAPPALAARADDYAESGAVLPDDVVASLTLLARRNRTTLGTVLAAGWAALLHRNSGSESVTFGVSLNGRPAELGDVSTMAGLYLTTLPLTVRTDPDATVGALLEAVAETAWRLGEVSAGESLGDVYEATGISPSRTLFHSVLVVQNFGGPGSGEPADEDALRVEVGHSRLLTGAPLTLAADPGSGSLRLVWDRRVFAQETADLLLDQFTWILAALAAGTTDRLSGLPAPVYTPRPLEPDLAPRTQAPAGTAPQGPTEKRVAAIWRESLGVDVVGREVNLFEVGANSMTITRLHARLCEEFGVSVPVPELFQHPTVQAQALLFGARSLSPARSGTGPGSGARGAQRRSALRRGATQRVPRRVPRDGNNAGSSDAADERRVP